VKQSALRIVCWKELRDAARDPRALLYLVGLPLLFYPALLLLLEFLVHELGAGSREPPYRVQITNVEGAPGIARALETHPLLVVTGSTNVLLGLAGGQATIGVEPMEGFDAAISAGMTPRVDVFVNQALPGAPEALAVVREALRGAFPESSGSSVLVVETPIGTPVTDFTFLVGLFPYFLIVLVLVGAAHMAIDVTAGEKERRTLETLLITPAARSSLLLGKVAATFLAAALSGALGLLGFAIAIHVVKLFVPNPLLLALPGSGFLPLGLGSLPCAFLFSTLLVALGTLARSAREGQTYAAYLQMPLLLLALSATWVPKAHASWLYVVPLLGLNLVQKEYLTGNGNPGSALVAALTTLALGFVLAIAAVRLFASERVLFRA